MHFWDTYPLSWVVFNHKVRIVKRSYIGRIRYFAQLFCEGKLHIKAKNTPKK